MKRIAPKSLMLAVMLASTALAQEVLPRPEQSFNGKIGRYDTATFVAARLTGNF